MVRADEIRKLAVVMVDEINNAARIHGLDEYVTPSFDQMEDDLRSCILTGARLIYDRLKTEGMSVVVDNGPTPIRTEVEHGGA